MSEKFKPWLIIVFLAIILLMVFVLNQQQVKTSDTSIELQLNKLVESHEVFKEYVEGKDFEKTIELLGVEKVKELNKELNLGLPEKTLYKIEFNNSVKGNFTAFIDLTENKVIKFIRLKGVNIK